MSIRILFFASLADISGVREMKVDASGLTDLRSVFDKFAKDFPLLENHRTSVHIAVNSEFARPETPVHDGDEIAFFPPVSGG
ncbi:MAG: molybdopterin converting factor subunit 1 [Acidobacteria bacterium]|nr:molybdopterin converting factor subunit 1 [Acidobacteriota bacterium]